jgi:O-antigen/teichoic acid export membrane protein
MPESVSTTAADSLSLAQRGIRGAAWNYGGAGVVIVGQLAYTALTARLISPSEFGAYATAQALLSLVGYFTLSTVGNAIIRHPALDRKVVGTGLIMTGTAGVAVAVVVMATAHLWADVWRSPGAATLIRLFAPQVVLGALAIVPLSLLRRDLRYRSASLIESSSVLIGFGVGGALALQLRSADALVAGQVATAGVLLALSATAARPQLAVAYSAVHARSLFSFSAQVSLQNLGHYLNNTLPSFAVSRFLGQASLGFFSRATLLVGIPLTFLAQGATKTLYPIYPRFRDNKEECRRMMIDVASVTTTMVWPLFAALAGLAPIVVELLLGAQWAPVASIVAPLCLYATVNFAYSMFASFTEALGYLRQIWLVQACWTVALVFALGLAHAWDADMRSIALMAAGVQIGAHLGQIALLARVKVIDAVGTLRAEAWAGLLAGAWYTVTMLTTHSLAGYDLAARIVAACGVTTLLALATWVALPYLPAGRAFSRRGIRIARIPGLPHSRNDERIV